MDWGYLPPPPTCWDNGKCSLLVKFACTSRALEDYVIDARIYQQTVTRSRASRDCSVCRSVIFSLTYIRTTPVVRDSTPCHSYIPPPVHTNTHTSSTVNWLNVDAAAPAAAVFVSARYSASGRPEQCESSFIYDYYHRTTCWCTYATLSIKLSPCCVVYFCMLHNRLKPNTHRIRYKWQLLSA